MPREEKVRAVQELAEKLRRASIAISTGYQGLSVSQMNELRQRLAEAGVELRVVKNTLLRRAAEEVGRQHVLALIEGPTALAFAYEDPLPAIKAIEEYLRTARTALTLRGAVLDGRVLGADETLALARLPSREELLGQLLGVLQAPLVRLLGVLQASPRGLLTVLQARREQLEGGGA
jgi:large subunit ribosomal protein L10